MSSTKFPPGNIDWQDTREGMSGQGRGHWFGFGLAVADSCRWFSLNVCRTEPRELLISGLREHACLAGLGAGEVENWTETGRAGKQGAAAQGWGAVGCPGAGSQGSGWSHKPLLWDPGEGLASPCATTATQPCGCKEGTDRKMRLSVLGRDSGAPTDSQPSLLPH